MRLRVRTAFAAMILAGLVALLAGATALQRTSSTPNTQAQGPSPRHGIEIDHMDRSVKPGDDFYLYCNGAWLEKTEIPPDRAVVSVWSRLEDLSDERTAALIEAAAKQKGASGSNPQKIADLYQSFMNESEIEKRGLDPLKPKLAAIAAIKDKKELARTLGESLRQDVDPLNNTNFHTMNLFGLWVAPGFEDYQHYIPYLLQGGLTLPDREHYLDASEHMREVRTKFQAHVVAMLKLADIADPEQRAARILELETAIAKTHRNLADNQDVHKANTIWTPAEFSAKAPGLDWAEYFRAAGLAGQQKFNVWQPEAFTGEAALVDSIPLDTWKDWLAFHAIEHNAGVLPKKFYDERFAFFGTALSGVAQPRPRAQRAVNFVNALLGDAVGQLYAEHYFSPQAKAEAEAMVRELIAAFRKRIDALSWMAAATKTEAKAKLDTLYVGIGYPEKWRDYSKYEVKPDDLFGNAERSELFEYHFWVDRLGKPVDRHEWSMTPQTVNAVNLPLQNALNFPAAVLQPPFYDPLAPAVTNYGAIGSVIGHEISHTFDTEGSTFDSHGRMRNWWTPADLKHFEDVTAQLARQYDQYRPFPDLAINGKQTLAENIADLAGIAAAYDGYRASLVGKPAPEKDGFTGDQQFFIAFGQNWGEKIRPGALREQVMTDPHAPGQFRALTVRNVDSWYGAFEVQSSQKLYLAPGDRVKIW